jgi:hypothetical protein
LSSATKKYLNSIKGSVKNIYVIGGPAAVSDKVWVEINKTLDNASAVIEQMVTLFPDFCQLIDGGNFYIACAMGLHRTDIALCTYWVFYGADHGLEPPTIRGYRKEDGHNTNKLMRILNALYQAFSDREGIAPMTELEFKQRKNIIIQQANQPNK